MDSSEGIENMDLSKLKVPELRKELKTRGLSTSGNKNELMERLQSAVKHKLDDTAASVDDLDEDLLNDDDDEHLDESDVALNDLDSPPIGDSLKRKSTDNLTSSVEIKAPKKIILNRKLSEASVDENTEVILDLGVKRIEEKIEPENGVVEEKKVIKLSELSAKERLEMRAKKFGVPLTGDAKKDARAERFGGSKSSVLANTVTASVDVLKSRAERFGVTTSTQLNKLESKEKLEKRKERFGGESAIKTPIEAATATAAPTNGAAAISKAQQRLERFKVA